MHTLHVLDLPLFTECISERKPSKSHCKSAHYSYNGKEHNDMYVDILYWYAHNITQATLQWQ